ncbi:MAG: hypothetical protein JST84_25170 [Acidobacteria bacterium]|nr:hypothetical protein [Acidobacteriota bacterium]
MKHSYRWFFVFFVVVGGLAGTWWLTKNSKSSWPETSQIATQRSSAQTQPDTADQRSAVAALPSSESHRTVPNPAARPQVSSSPLPEALVEKLNEELGEKRRYDKPAEAAEYYRLKRLPPGEKEIPVERYLVAKTQMEAMPQYSSAQNRVLPSSNELKTRRTEATPEALGTWAPLGPGNIGGRTRTLVIHPTNPNVMYTAGVSGGVWKTEDGGNHWQPLTDFLANLAVCSLAIDPKNPQVLYAGTGEGYFNIGSIRGAGIFKTSDGGANWQQLASTNTQDFYYVNDLVVSPINSQRLYAATDTGVWRSLDAGATWTRTLDPDLVAGCLDLVIRTDQATDYVFAACGTFEQSSVYRNANAADSGTWDKVLSESNMGRTSLALAPSNQNVVYAAAAWTDGGEGVNEGRLRAVWRSSSSGDAGTWMVQTSATDTTRPGELLFSNPIAASMSDCGFDYDNELIHQGWFDNVIAVDPLDENRVWVGGVDLFRSDDGGRRWGVASYWWDEKSSPSYAHADQHIIAFHPNYNGTTNKQMFVGSDGGIFRTDDARAAVALGTLAACSPHNTKVRWTSLNQGLAVTQFYHGLPLANGQSYFGGTQDNGTVLGTEASGANKWREIHGGDGGFVAIDPTNPNVLFATNPGGFLVKSTDGGVTFSPAMFGLEDNGALFIAPVVIDPSDSQRLWLGGSKLWRTNRGGANWSAASVGPGFVSAIAIAPTDSNVVLAGNANGAVIRTDKALLADANTQWIISNPRQGFVSGLAFDPTNAKIAYATYSTFGGAHVWRTMDGGATWSSIDGFGAGSLPDIPVNCIVVDPMNSARLFVGTDLGVFVSTDGGSVWNVENTGFANVSVSALSTQSINGVTNLFAFTYGRGAWRVTLGGSTGCVSSLSSTVQSFGVAGGSGTVSVQGGCSWDAVVNETGAGWLTFTRAGNDVTYTVAANQTQKKRTGSLTIAGRSFVILQEAFQDVTPPTLNIVSPIASGTYTSESNQIVISGTASDNVALTSINVENDREVQPYGNTGTLTNWNLTGMRLLPGINTFTVTVWDSSNNKTSAQISVLYKPQVSRVVVAGNGNPNYQGDGGPATATGISAKDIALDQNGNFYLGGQYGGRVRKVTAANGIITTIAGGGEKYEDGVATAAALHSPEFVATDRNGNVYFAEPIIHIIRKVTPAGQIQTVVGSVGNYTNAVGGYGGDGGPATQARLNTPQGIAVDHLGNLYIADQGNYRVRRVSPDGVITTVAGSGLSGSTGDGGPATSARMYPYDVAVDAAGNLYILESTRVRKVNVSTGIITTVAGGGGSTDDNLPATQTSYGLIKGLALGQDGAMYFSDYRTNKVFRVGTDGISRTLATVPGVPLSLDVDSAGAVYVVEQSTAVVSKLVNFAGDATPPTIKITGPSTNGSYIGTVNYLNIQGNVTDNLEVTHAVWRNDRGGNGKISIGWPGQPNFWQQMNIPLKPGRNVVTVTAWDVAGNSSSDVLNVDFVIGTPFSTVAGTRVSGYGGDNANGVAAQLWSPETLIVDAAGNIFVAERGNHTVRKIKPDGTITTFAGTGQLGSSGDDGPAAAALLNEPSGLALDAAGNLYIADTNNHRIRKVSANGIISNFAGTGVGGFGGDGGAATAAQLALPVGLVFDQAGNLFVADAGNNRVRKITPTGTISTFAGGKISTSNNDNIPATEFPLKFPTALAFSPSGELYISDTGKNSIRKVNATGILTTAVRGDQGLSAPGNLAFDRKGVLYIADQKNNRVALHVPGYNSAGWLTGARPDNNLSSGAIEELSLKEPAGVTIDRNGNLLIADTGNHRIVKLEFKSSVTTVSGASYAVQPVAAGSIVSAFGINLANVTQGAQSLPLPQEIGGTRVRLRDSTGIEAYAPLFYVSPLQINYQIPETLSPGYVSITITNNGRNVPTEYLLIGPLSPGLFAANQNGSGVAAGSVLYVTGENRRSENNAACDANGQNCTSRQIDLNSASEVYLELYGTGIRNNSGLANVTVTIGGVAVPVLYAGKQPEFVGLDQVNVQLPRSLAGRGEVDVVLTLDGKAANPVKINLK